MAVSGSHLARALLQLYQSRTSSLSLGAKHSRKEIPLFKVIPSLKVEPALSWCTATSSDCFQGTAMLRLSVFSSSHSCLFSCLQCPLTLTLQIAFIPPSQEEGACRGQLCLCLKALSICKYHHALPPTLLFCIFPQREDLQLQKTSCSYTTISDFVGKVQENYEAAPPAAEGQ